MGAGRKTAGGKESLGKAPTKGSLLSTTSSDDNEA